MAGRATGGGNLLRLAPTRHLAEREGVTVRGETDLSRSGLRGEDGM